MKIKHTACYFPINAFTHEIHAVLLIRINYLKKNWEIFWKISLKSILVASRNNIVCSLQQHKSLRDVTSTKNKRKMKYDVC